MRTSALAPPGDVEPIDEDVEPARVWILQRISYGNILVMTTYRGRCRAGPSVDPFFPGHADGERRGRHAWRHALGMRSVGELSPRRSIGVAAHPHPHDRNAAGDAKYRAPQNDLRSA